MNRYAALALVALIGAGCSNAPAENGAATATPTRDRAMTFSECMRDNGVREFPDPDARGELTIDAIANGSSVDTDGPAWKAALRACKDLQPAGFTGRKRTSSEQEIALEFAQCMRDNGIEDFPDPAEGAPLIDTNRIPSARGRGALEIPGFKAAQEACQDVVADLVGR